MTHSLLTFLRQLSARLSTKSNEDDEDEDVDDDDEDEDVDDDDEIEEVDDEEADDGDGDEEENGNSYFNLMKVLPSFNFFWTNKKFTIMMKMMMHDDDDVFPG